MNVVILSGKTKRRIEGPFAICASRADLRILRKAIKKALEKDFSYGWVVVGGEVSALANTPPVIWDDDSVERINVGLRPGANFRVLRIETET